MRKKKAKNRGRRKREEEDVVFLFRRPPISHSMPMRETEGTRTPLVAKTKRGVGEGRQQASQSLANPASDQLLFQNPTRYTINGKTSCKEKDRH